MLKTIGFADYLRPMQTFLKGLPDALRNAGEGLTYYGTGEAGHWAVQCNQQMLGALAVQAELTGNTDLRQTALELFRYSMRTHLTGDMVCTDGKQWGKHWISVLGMERATPGLNALEPYFTDDDRERYRKFRIFEADYRLHEYPVQACMDASKGPNVPESNIWNAAFLMRAALDHPELPQAEDYLEKACTLMLNGLSAPQDAQNTTVYRGKTVAERHVGPNFTENFSLDHHGYMNVGYSFICLSNLALLYFNFKERGQTPPPELFHNIKPLWETVKHLTFPDGRLLRIGGDSRTRYNYCQCFAVNAWLLAAELFKDPDAVRFEAGYLDLIEQEQAQNEDGSFYGKRLTELKNYSYYYYRRLEADPMLALSTGAWWRKKFDIISDVPEQKTPDAHWGDDFHKADLIRTGNTVRSAVQRANHGQEILCVPLDRSDMAEWAGNLTGYIGCHYIKENGDAARKTFDGGFLYTRASDIFEQAPMGEGEEIYQVAKRQYAAAALPDGKTMLIYERAVMTKETTFTFGFRALNCQIPNDVYNGHKRLWTTEDGKFFQTVNLPGVNDLLETGSAKLNCDNALSFFSLQEQSPFRIKRSAKQNVMLSCGMWSMYADVVCMDSVLDPVRLMPGDVIYESACAVSADTTADDMLRHPCGTMTSDGPLRRLTFTGFDGRTYTMTVHTQDGTAEICCNGETL